MEFEKMRVFDFHLNLPKQRKVSHYLLHRIVDNFQCCAYAHTHKPNRKMSTQFLG